MLRSGALTVLHVAPESPLQGIKHLLKSAMQVDLWRITMDIMGPLPETPRGNRYVLVVGDYFTKWKEAYQLPDMEALSIAKVLVSEFICRFGVPDSIHTDQGKNFEAKVIQEICHLLGVTKTRTTPYHLQSDGLVKRFNRTLLEMLSTAVADEHDLGPFSPNDTSGI